MTLSKLRRYLSSPKILLWFTNRLLFLFLYFEGFQVSFTRKFTLSLHINFYLYNAKLDVYFNHYLFCFNC